MPFSIFTIFFQRIKFCWYRRCIHFFWSLPISPFICIFRKLLLFFKPFFFLFFKNPMILVENDFGLDYLDFRFKFLIVFQYLFSFFIVWLQGINVQTDIGHVSFVQEYRSNVIFMTFNDLFQQVIQLSHLLLK